MITLKNRLILVSNFLKRIIEPLILRRIFSIVIAISIIVLFLYVVNFDTKYNKKYVKEINIKEISDKLEKTLIYNLNFTSFDTENKIIKGSLMVQKGLPSFPENSKFYSQLFYDDVVKCSFAGIYNGRSLFSDLSLRCKIKKIKFFPEIPKPIPVKFTALGNPAYYPFDSYIIAGAVKCLVCGLINGKRKFLNPPPKTNEALHIKNSILGLFLRKPNDQELLCIGENYLLLEKHPFKSIKKFCNNDESFILMAERPMFLKVITIVMGILAFFAALFIGFKSSTDKFFINIVGFIIGVWGIRSIILGNTHLFLIYLDYYILGLYLIASVGFVLRFLWNGRISSDRS